MTHLQFASISTTTPCGRVLTQHSSTPYLAEVDCPECLRWVSEWRRPNWWTAPDRADDRAFVDRRPDHAHDRGAVSQ